MIKNYLDITAAACGVRIGQLVDARAAADHRVTALGKAKRENAAALKQLYRRMTGLRAELDQRLADDD